MDGSRVAMKTMDGKKFWALKRLIRVPCPSGCGTYNGNVIAELSVYTRKQRHKKKMWLWLLGYA